MCVCVCVCVCVREFLCCWENNVIAIPFIFFVVVFLCLLFARAFAGPAAFRHKQLCAVATGRIGSS